MRTDDDIAIERYRYLLRTAPPETIEQVHAEAFGKLTPQQRHTLYEQLKRDAQPGEAPRGDDPQSLASAATRSELRQPGSLERSFQGPSFLGMFGSSLLGTVAGFVIASALVSAFLPDVGGGDAASDGGDAGAGSGADGGGASADGGGAVADGGGMDFGGDFGGF